MTTLDRCAICGDEAAIPAECPDRHGWEDHGVCCIGNCQVCAADLADQAQIGAADDAREQARLDGWS